ncbi:twin-arginine translocation pathway signal [Tolypothrix tenuis PCC 7101]|uniref:Twin-arginine translocation pathway signal n=1 Tax=Tolypothrix tenuis PCC 7101 TaxID=231146 RepID=A0A1Z4MRY2_9CYAN|nr:vanadium-dependent haloperoxidase [Aulosira sp. FACHB-113]BAY96244.1 twin-arginine translocation pathway signal [Tolypothrix tenuis PCC 7101]BAZ73249.1 twin-arginine translocation pathway signal [Aulosira laxa NIES-50]
MPVDPYSHESSEQDALIPSETPKVKRTGRFLFGGASRRSFLGRVGLFTTSSVVAGVLGSSITSKKGDNIVQAAEPKAKSDHNNLREKAFQVRTTAAKNNREIPIPPHPTNGDEEKYANKIATDTRGLPHNQLGEVDLKAYQSFINALNSGDPNEYEKIILGGKRKLVQPLTPLAISLSGVNTCQLAIPVPPTLDSAEQAAEFLEIAWQQLLQDVPFSEFRNDTTNPLILAAVQDLNRLSAFKGPKQNGKVTPELLFRGTAIYADGSGKTTYHTLPGVEVGPYVSQFLLRPIPAGTHSYAQLNRVPAAIPENTFQTNYDEWLLVQNGGDPGRTIKFDSTRRYFINGRDQSEIAHTPPPVYTNAALILVAKPSSDNPLGGGVGSPYNSGNPYNKSKTQVGGSGTFGPGYAQSLIGWVSPHAIRAAYWQKYYVHRRLRAEAYGGLVHNNKVNKTNYPIHQEVFKSEALDRIYSKYKSYLLPQAFPEGAPFHSSYPGGASVSAGASVTILKALFDENYVIPNPVIPDPKDPTKLIPYQGPPLTVGGELNKLAANIGLGRDSAGIHWRTDAAASLALGEAIAIGILKDEKLTFREIFEGFTFTKFDGTKVTI